MDNTQVRKSLISPIVQIAAVIILIAGLMAASSIILPLLLALFISIICAQPIFWLVKRKVPKSLAILMVIGSVILIFFILGSLVGNSLSQFSNNLPLYEENLNEVAQTTLKKLNLSGGTFSADNILAKIDAKKVLGFTSEVVGEIGALMSNSFLILLISIFILAETSDFSSKVNVLKRDYGRTLSYFNGVAESIRHYLSLKTMVSLLTGVIIGVSLRILGVDYAVLWGVIAFLLNYIPNIGSIIAAVPTMLLALVQLGLGGFIWTGVIYLAVNTIVGNFVEPKVMGKGLGLSTLVVFLSLIVWGYIFGTVGMFLSVPLTLTIKIILEKNENTKWIAFMLGAEQDTKIES